VTWPGCGVLHRPRYELRQAAVQARFIAARLVEDREGKRPPPGPPWITTVLPKRRTYGKNGQSIISRRTMSKTASRNCVRFVPRHHRPPRQTKSGQAHSEGRPSFRPGCSRCSRPSSRRFMSDLRDARDKGFLLDVMNPSTVRDFHRIEGNDAFLYQIIETVACRSGHRIDVDPIQRGFANVAVHQVVR